MNKEERIKMVKAMEFICRHINDEDKFAIWLAVGVADGDIDDGDLMVKPEDEDDLEYYYSDDVDFADLMDTFLYLMKRARTNGGIFCDGVVSEEAEVQ